MTDDHAQGAPRARRERAAGLLHRGRARSSASSTATPSCGRSPKKRASRCRRSPRRGRSRPRSSRTSPGGAARSSRSGRSSRVDVARVPRLEDRVPVAERSRLERAPGAVRRHPDASSSTSGSRAAEGFSSASSTASGSSPTTSSTWFNELLVWLTWIGTTVAGHAARLALRRTACRGLGARRVRVVRDLGPVGGEHGDARAHARRGRACRS